ncbi:MAG: twin-arginine translocase TatA/TatE family subunit [Thermus sp.]|uniref:Sec-independent protein translocase subunit TatA/TatB n=1 Tax=Thermus sp. TaxID=275 RepID=UPI00331B6716
MIDSPAQIIAILVVALLLFGPRKLPELARGLGQSVREFKRSVEGVGESFKEAASEEKAVKKEEAAQPSQGEGQKTSEHRR